MGKREEPKQTHAPTHKILLFNLLISCELGLGFARSSSAWPARSRNRRSHRRSRAMRSRRWGSPSSRRWSSWSPAPPATRSLSMSLAPTPSWPRADPSPTIFARPGSPSASSGTTPAPSSSPPATSKVWIFRLRFSGFCLGSEKSEAHRGRHCALCVLLLGF